MEFFNPKYVYFMWNPILEGKKGFTANDIVQLQNLVNDGNQCQYELRKGWEDKPFMSGANNYFRFAYVDPNYKIKVAYLKGESVEFKYSGKWITTTITNFDAINWDELEWRIKPKEEDCNICGACVYDDSPCVPSDYEKDKHGFCDHFKRRDDFDEGELDEQSVVYVDKYGDEYSFIVCNESQKPSRNIYFEGNYQHCMEFCYKYDHLAKIFYEWEFNHVPIQYKKDEGWESWILAEVPSGMFDYPWRTIGFTVEEYKKLPNCNRGTLKALSSRIDKLENRMDIIVDRIEHLCKEK